MVLLEKLMQTGVSGFGIPKNMWGEMRCENELFSFWPIFAFLSSCVHAERHLQRHFHRTLFLRRIGLDPLSPSCCLRCLAV